MNTHGHDGDTPLMLAVRLRNAELVRQILMAPGLDLHRPSLDSVPVGKAALDFAPEGSSIHAMLLEAISRSQARRETRSVPEACEGVLGGLKRLVLDPAGPVASWAAGAGPVGCFPCWLP